MNTHWFFRRYLVPTACCAFLIASATSATAATFRPSAPYTDFHFGDFEASITVTSDSAFTSDWLINDLPIGDWGGVSGAHSDLPPGEHALRLEIQHGLWLMGSAVSVEVINADGTFRSEREYVPYYDCWLSTWSSGAFYEGEAVYVFADCCWNYGAQYQWYHNGLPLGEAGTVPRSDHPLVLELRSLSISDEGTYWLRLSNDSGFYLDTPSITVTVQPALQLQWPKQNALVTRREGELPMFSPGSTGGEPPFTIVVRKTDSEVDEVDDSLPLAPPDSGRYTLTISDAYSTQTASFILKVIPGAKPIHDVDLDQDASVSLGELLRTIQIFNGQQYHCDGSTEDGYAPGVGAQLCSPHSSDFQDTDWSIGLSELLRTIQFYNLGGPFYCPTSQTEDSFCIAPSAA